MFFDRARQIFELQSKARRLQRELKETLVEGEALDGKIKVVVSGEQKVQQISIDPSLLGSDNRVTLELQLKSALNSALARAQEQAANKMEEITGNVDITKLLGGNK